MIIVKLMGGLGNQMFQYATARQLAHKHKTQLRLDLSVFDNMAEIDTPRHYELNCYKISGKVAAEDDLTKMLPVDHQATFSYRVMRRLGLDTRLRPFGEPGKSFTDIYLRVRDNSYLVGWWQNEKYFQNIRDILLKEFTPKKISPFSKKVAKQINDNVSVSIHVRRGDYVTNKYSNKEHGLASPDYYNRAIQFINKKAKNPRYFVFSDDLEWCKKNLKLGKDAVFVDENGTKRPWEDIWLMQRCNHNIVANSSFSWWGAWLNNHPDKIVVAPKIWFQNPQSENETEIVPKNWIRL